MPEAPGPARARRDRCAPSRCTRSFPVKHLTMGDDAAALLLSYAALMAQRNRGDEVTVRAIGADGDEVDVGFLLNSGTVLLIESSTSTLPEPDNGPAIDYMRERLAHYDPTDDLRSPFDLLDRDG